MIALGLAAVLTLSAAPQLSNPESIVLTPAETARANEIARHLRCATCQGMSVLDSPSSMARSQLTLVKQMVLEGKSDQEIRDFFEARYGEWALLEPKVSGSTWLVWLGPGIAFLVGLFIVFRMLARPGEVKPAST